MNLLVLTVLIAGSVHAQTPAEQTSLHVSAAGVFEAHFAWSPEKMIEDENDPGKEIFLPPYLVGTFKADEGMDRKRSRLLVDGVDMTEYLFSGAAGPVASPIRKLSVEKPGGKARIEMVVYDRRGKDPVYREEILLAIPYPELVEGPRGAHTAGVRKFKRDEIPKDVLKNAPPEYRQ